VRVHAPRIDRGVHAAITYEYGTTTVETTAAEALAGGRGVCQDQAHLMLALCHLLGLPARYVSGHLLGQGGTHAWAEVIVPSGGEAMATPFDPAMTGAGYPVRHGRDRTRLCRCGTDFRNLYRGTRRSADYRPGGRCDGHRRLIASVAGRSSTWGRAVVSRGGVVGR
jgi:hypothetical protein